MFGGSAESWAGSDEKQPKLADTTLLQFSKCIHAVLSQDNCDIECIIPSQDV